MIRSAGTKEKESEDNNEFTTRAIMSLALESSELMQAVQRISVIVAALALTYGVSTDV